MRLLRLSIEQTLGQIGMETNNAKQEIEHNSPGQQTIEQKPATLEFHSSQGELQIDQSQAWQAYAKGGHQAWLNMIYSQMDSVFLQGLAKKVEEGKRMAQITNPSNAFADIAKGALQDKPEIQYVGPASFMNVTINYTANSPEINIQANKPEINYTVSKPEFTYTPGKVDIYMRQMQSINITVSEYDWYK
ncbi:DUF6470 family protein [Paenibacillus oleatilyticus]|uniref:DUF6470 family protein n=1 Tax=Paenibacillus oleatilyticus TaxID=2594886 RepID=UPI001C1FCD0B|nr:DUF6470 family protein [Paenibacillus oleatilyticus]MBU7317597.1 hypothetical protein [Paenibacillus oleatilyticus]